MLIYRVEHKELRVGPYSPDTYPYEFGVTSRPDRLRVLDAAPPHSSPLYSCWQPKNKNGGKCWCLSIEECKCIREYRFGTRSLKSLIDWFSKPVMSLGKNLGTMLEVLSKHDFVIAVYIAPPGTFQVEPSPGKQIAFEYERAKFVGHYKTFNEIDNLDTKVMLRNRELETLRSFAHA